MAISFPQTTRALQADQDKISLLALVFMLIMLSVWAIWLFTAQINHYASSNELQLIRNPQPEWLEVEGSRRPVSFTRYKILAHFKSQDIQKIHANQAANIVFDSTSTLPVRSFKSEVKTVHQQTGKIEVELRIPSQQTGLFQYAHLSRLDIVTSSQTPLAFLFHLATKPSRQAPPINHSH